MRFPCCFVDFSYRSVPLPWRVSSHCRACVCLCHTIVPSVRAVRARVCAMRVSVPCRTLAPSVRCVRSPPALSVLLLLSTLRSRPSGQANVGNCTHPVILHGKGHRPSVSSSRSVLLLRLMRQGFQAGANHSWSLIERFCPRTNLQRLRSTRDGPLIHFLFALRFASSRSDRLSWAMSSS